MKKNQVCWNKSSKKLVGESNSQKQVSNVQSVKNADNAEEKLYYAGKISDLYCSRYRRHAIYVTTAEATSAVKYVYGLI